MNKDFNLVYYHKETGEKYFVKMISKHDYIVLDPRTNTKLPLSKHFLDKYFKSDKRNSKSKEKTKLQFRNWNKTRAPNDTEK